MTPTTEDVHSLAHALGPVLVDQTGGRLGDLQWFRSTWQRGGAATAFASWRAGDASIPVMVKLPVGPVEHGWTTRLGAVDPDGWDTEEARRLPTPRVLASGLSLGGYDLAWLVIEKLNGQTLAHEWTGEALVDLLGAVADLQARAIALAPAIGPRQATDWDSLLHRSRDAIRTHGLPESQRWNESVRSVQRALPRLATRWEHRAINGWCHGDVHAGNAMRRAAAPGEKGPCVLIDLAFVHPGHWVEDAVYLERQHWGHADMLHSIKPVSLLAKLRRERGLPTNDDYGGLANVRRILMAACAPVYFGQEGNPKYLHAALATIESLLPLVSR